MDVKPHIDAERERFLPEVLRHSGYRTAAASANVWISTASGYSLGFDYFREVDSGRQAKLNEAGPRKRAGWWREAMRARVDDGAAEIERSLHSWIEDVRDPFFCFVNLIECHSPYLAPRPRAVGSPLERVLAAEDARRHYTLEEIWKICLGGVRVSESALRRLRRQYAASILYMDDFLARLMEMLSRNGRLDETLLIVTADHGENFGEGGFIAHSLSLDNRLIHVPLVVAGPGVGDHDLHSLAGLPRFIAETVGLPEHPWLADDLPLDVGVAQHDPVISAGDPKAREVVVDRWGLGDEELARFTCPLTCAVSGSHKLELRGETELWIDLEADPLELDPMPTTAIPDSDRDALFRLRRAIKHPAMTASRPFKGERSHEASPEELKQLEERMRLLGYL